MEWQTPQYNGKNLLLVEGLSDKAFYGHFVSSQTELRSSGEEYGGGCRLLLSVLRELRRISPINCIAIKDRDFDGVNQTMICEDGLFYTDYHDHEMFYLSSWELISKSITPFSVSFEKEDSDKIISSLTTLTYLKWYNYSNHTNWTLKRIKAHCLSPETLQNANSLVNLAIANSKADCIVDLSDFYQFCSSHPWNDEWQLLNGHDYLRLLFAHVSKNSRINVSIDCLKESIISNYSLEVFSNTQLYISVHDWASLRNTNIFR